MDLQMDTTQYNWNQIYDSDCESFADAMHRLKRSQQWNYIEHIIRTKYGHIEGLCTIEIGSGMAKASALLAMLGAHVTAIDNNEKAIESAIKLFSWLGCDGEFIIADALKLPEHLLSRFDVALSIGTGEHFTGINRKLILESHYKVLKANGSAFFVVPNAFCIRYNALMNLSALLGIGLEKEYPFRKKELLILAKNILLTGNSVVGLNYKEAIERFKFTDLIKNTANHYFPQLTKLIREQRGRESKKNYRKKNAITRNLSALTIPSENKRIRSIDNIFGYALVLHGTKV
jgi:2-polyprenyl-3-methyl-5-hydroxy-6-metoxy-1,4-benzoquinol methylase